MDRGYGLEGLALTTIPEEDLHRPVCVFVKEDRSWDWHAFAHFLPLSTSLKIVAIQVLHDHDEDDLLI